ncbi:fibronectin type III domain-containing protein [Lacinutrix neustonica]|uniref:Fibronectin type III domain-containing protein n=1 Tax=Lacinutrix neustonica TaxID=2980107 RepID=A0A9E8MX06_9FLAO|nr:fibronectin type III domain-containing protein [Lacinutrix neustonica]WAC03193.1 fibronectin type III domain-containing protein [Lacinutrix neustonica]
MQKILYLGIEDNRNAYHADDTNTYGQGNRNPFIDNPYLATAIWGGTPAQNRWGSQPPPDTQAPTTPTNLVASNPTETTIDLAWTASTDNVGVVAYQIFIDGVFYTASNATATTFTVTDLTPETTYTFTVLARDAATNNSPMSAESNPKQRFLLRLLVLDV